MRPFFIDTANTKYIETLWEQLQSHVDPQNVVGVTTNPNAFLKTSDLTLPQWFSRTKELCKLVTQIRGDDRGVVYVQGPSSNMTPQGTLDYAKRVRELGDGQTKVGLKIPPYQDILRIVPQLSTIVDVNVTGVADAGTALKCASYGVRYVSVIPGRMEEAGIDASRQIAYIRNANLFGTDIIAGSMRTIAGLKWTIEYGTVPTIGERVWNLLLESPAALEMITSLEVSSDIPVLEFCPVIDSRSFELSHAFFQQMNQCGQQAAEALWTL